MPITCIIGERQPEAARRGPQAARAIRPLPIEQPVTEAAGRAPPWPEGRNTSRGTTWGPALYDGCVLIYSNGSTYQACRLISIPYGRTVIGSARIRAIAAPPVLSATAAARSGCGVSWVYSHSHTGVTGRAVTNQHGVMGGVDAMRAAVSVGMAALLIDGGRIGHPVR